MNIYFLIPFILFISLLIFFHKNISSKLSLVDKPNLKTSFHKKATPLTGGLFLFIYFFLLNLNEIYFLNNFSAFGIQLLFFFTFAINLLDDLYDLKASLRILLLFFTTYILLTFFLNLGINKVYFSISDTSVSFSDLQIIIIYTFSIVFIQIVFNLTDGINCLLKIYSLILIIIVTQIELGLNDKNFLLLLTIILIGYLNYKQKLFLGSSGNSLLALYFAVMIIEKNTENFQNFSFELVFLMFGFLIIDSLKIFLFRIYQGKNIFNKDLNHLHHKLNFKFGLNLAILIYCVLGLLPFLLAYNGFINDQYAVLILFFNYLFIQLILK
jgi:UDP-GlcNAc:undecaprenyl-phosphate GlcNAc-1-phosphate transferase